MSAMNLFIIEDWNHSSEELQKCLLDYCKMKNIGVMFEHKKSTYKDLLNELCLKKNYFSLTDASDDYECMDLLRLPYEITFETIEAKFKVFDDLIKLLFEKYNIKKIILFLATADMYSLNDFDTFKKIKSIEFIPMFYNELKSVVKKYNVWYIPDLCIEIEK